MSIGIEDEIRRRETRMHELKKAIEGVLACFGPDADVEDTLDSINCNGDFPELVRLREVYEAVKERL